MIGKKFQPSDGTEEETQEWETAEREQKDRMTSEEKTLEDFVSQAETEYEERQLQKREMLEKLKKERGLSAEDTEEYADESVATPKTLYGDEIAPRKTFSANRETGIFNKKGTLNSFGKSNPEIRMKRVLKSSDLKGIAIKKQREFMQLLQRYHGFKDRNLGTLSKDEVIKFENGLRRGSSDLRFDQFKEDLEREGIIKNSDDIKKLFKKQDIKRISNALTGKKNDSGRFDRINKADLASRKAEGGGIKRPDRLF